MDQFQTPASPPPHSRTRVTSVTALLDRLDGELQAGQIPDLHNYETGFRVLDETISGGLHPGELALMGGPPGVGKTIVTLQWARNMARKGAKVLFICYEHEELSLLTRLICLEAGELGGDRDVARAVSSALLRGAEAKTALAAALGDSDIVKAALENVSGYADNLTLVRASGAHTGLPEIQDLVDTTDRVDVIFLDYIQKIPIVPHPPTESEKITRTVEALKELSLSAHVPIIAISAVDTEGLRADRLRLHHLRGSSALAFECDVALILNEKIDAVSKVHLAYDPVRAATFADWVIMSVEKNRGGPNLIDLEFRKDFAHYRFDPDGGQVAEKLINERSDEELV